MSALLTLLVTLLAPPAPAHGGATFERCDRCHVATDWHTMRTGVTGFDHDATGFPLRGQHRTATCSACHTDRPLTGGDCTQCHQDTHRGELDPRCDRCHDSRTWAVPQARRDHDRLRLPLVGRHAGVACRDCHPRATGHTFRAVPADCADCHRAEALSAAVHPPHTSGVFATRCVDCHTPYGWRPAQVRHDRYWPLTGAHRAALCGDCHVAGRYAGTDRDCAACHQADFAAGHRPGDPMECADCHTTTAWLPAAFPDHDRFFPLPHEGVRDCQDCHPNGTRSFSFTTCHAHAQGEMAEEHDEVGGYTYESTACLRCHPRGRE